MEILLLLVLLIALPVVFVSAKRGAEAAQLERAERWGGLSEPRGAGLAAKQPGPPELRASGGAGAGSRGPVVGGVTGVRAERVPGGNGSAATEGAGTAAAAPGRPSPAPGRPVRIEATARRVAGSAAQNASATARSVRSTASAALRRQPAPIDINRAPVSELQSLPGVGVRAAERIVAHRDRHGGFASVDDLAAVEGFDQHRVDRLAPQARV